MKRVRVIKRGKHYFKIGSIVTVSKEGKRGVWAYGDFGNAQFLFNDEYEFV